MGSLTDSGRENIAVKLVFQDSLFSEEEEKSLSSGKKQFLVCQRMERWVDRWGDEGEEERISRRQLERCKETLLLEVIYEEIPAKNNPKLNNSLF